MLNYKFKTLLEFLNLTLMFWLLCHKLRISSMEAMFVVCLTFQRFQTVLCLTFQVVSGLRPKALLEEDIQFTEGKKKLCQI